MFLNPSPLAKTVMNYAVSRREALLEGACALTFGSALVAGCGGDGKVVQMAGAEVAAGLPPVQAGSGLVAQSAIWKRLPVGAGGFITGIDFSNDGSTKLIRTDTSNGYVWDDGRGQWRPLFTVSSLGLAETRATMDDHPLGDGMGVYEARVAPSDPNRIYAVFQAHVWRSDNKGLNFVRTSLPAKQMRGNTGAQRLWGPKMAVDPANPDVVYLGTEVDGLWRTLDGGKTWSQVADVPKSTSNALPLLLAFDATSGTANGRTKVLYVSSDGNGVYRTEDAGERFALTVNGPTKSKRMICDQQGTLWYVENGGGERNLLTFSAGQWSRTTYKGHPIHAVAINPADARHIYAISDDGIPQQSFDRGATWMGPWFAKYPDGEGWRINAVDIPWLAYQLDMSAGDLRFDPSGTNKLYFAMGVGVLWSNPPKTFTRIDWHSQSAGIEQLVGEWIVSPPKTADGRGGEPLVLAWDRPIFKIKDITKFPEKYGPVKPLHHGWHADYSVTDPTFIVGLFNYAGVEESGWSEDGGDTWTKFAATPSDARGGCIAVSRPDNIVVVPSNNGRAVYTKDRGKTWTPLSIPGLPTSGESGWGWAYYLNRKIVAADTVKPDVFYLYNYGPESNRSLAGMYRSTDGGANWVRAFAGPIADWSGFNAKMLAVPGQQGHLFFTSGGQSGDNPADVKFMRSTDGGTTWTWVAKVREVFAFGFGKAAPDKTYPAIYMQGYVDAVYGFWASFDNCQTWLKLTEFPADNIDKHSCVSGDLNIFGRFYVGFSGSGFAYGDVSAWAAGA